MTGTTRCIGPKRMRRRRRAQVLLGLRKAAYAPRPPAAFVTGSVLPVDGGYTAT